MFRFANDKSSIEIKYIYIYLFKKNEYIMV